MSEQSLEMSSAEARHQFADVLNAASARGRITYITSRSRRVAAVVPLQIAERAEQEHRLTPAEADAAHAHSCTCGDRAGHEAEDGSDYTIPRDDNEEN